MNYRNWFNMCSKFWNGPIIHLTQYVYLKGKKPKMDRPVTQQLKDGEQGFYPRGVRPCNSFNQGYRCTRQIYHEGPHASHILRGIEGTTKIIPVNPNEPEGEKQIVPREPGMKTEEVVQVATWFAGAE